MDSDANKVSANGEDAAISAAMSKTTTISTIAVQSGKTRIVIALLHCGDWIHLKIIEITPELTTLGNTLAEALELQKAHNEVLRQLQNKQSPVEELLRQADQLIATQRPRAEVYAAMAESLGRAWRDINATLELRKIILDLNVQYHTVAKEFFEKNDALEAVCSESTVPVDIEAVKEFLTTIHDLRRGLLETLMGALQSGNALLEKLKELGAEGTLDSRPDRIRSSVNRAISQVQSWLDELHIKRQIIEISFNRRKTQLEQCLALALLAADLKELEETLLNRKNILANSNELGDSSSSAELLLHEHKKILPEAKQLQERALKITKATEQLVASGCFAGEQATEKSYKILSSTSEYLTDLQHREILLERARAFFRNAQTVLNKLDQLEIQLKTTDLPKNSTKLADLHAQCAKTVEESTQIPISEGYAIINLAGHKGTEGIRKMVEELENMKILLNGLCTAHREENQKISSALNHFIEKHDEIYTWLVTIAEAFLQGHQYMGGDLRLAEDFMELHNQLQSDLQTKGNEINQLLLTLPPILEYLEDAQRTDVDSKVEGLHNRWMKLKNILENRIELARIFVKFHMEADIVNTEMDLLESSIRDKPEVDESTMRIIEEKFEKLIPYFQSAKNTGLTFISETNRISETHLDIQRARNCVESVLERLSGRQLNVTKTWQTYRDQVEEKREVLVRLERTMAESTKTINWVSKLDSQLYPVITINSNKSREIVAHLEHKLETVLPNIRKAQQEVSQKIKSAEELIAKSGSTDEQSLQIKAKLGKLCEKLMNISSEYQILLQVLIGYFKNLDEIDTKAESYNAQNEELRFSENLPDVESILRKSEVNRETILERFRFAQSEREQIEQRIQTQEPTEVARQDIEKLRRTLELSRSKFEEHWRQKHETIRTFCKVTEFTTESKEIRKSITEVTHQLREIRNQAGESLTSAKTAGDNVKQFTRVTESLNLRIIKLKDKGEQIQQECPNEATHVISEISNIELKWSKVQNDIQETKEVINKNIRYYELIEEANDWFRAGSKILVQVARKSTVVKQPQEAEKLLQEINSFLTPGEPKQIERIKEISQLAREISGPNESNAATVINGNKEMLDSFKSICNELSQLSTNLVNAEHEKLKMLREQEEARRAEDARRVEEERLVQERIAAEERRIKEEARLAEERRKAEAERLRIQKQLAEQKLQAEKERLAQEARLAEQRRIAEEERQAKENRLAEEYRRQQEALLAAEARRVEAAKLEVEQLKIQQIKFLEEAKRAEEERRRLEIEDRKKLEEARLAEEARRNAESKKLEEEKWLAEQARNREQQLLKEQHDKLDEERRRLQEEKLNAERARLEEERIHREQRKIEEEKIKLQKAQLEEQRVQAERAKIENERQRLKQAQLDNEKRKTEEARLEEMRKAELRIEELRKTEEANLEALRAREEKERQKRLAEEKIKLEQFRIDEQKRIEEEIKQKHHSVQITEVKESRKIESLPKEKSPTIEEPQESPIFISPLTDAIIQEGSKFTFVCQVTDSHPAPKVTWSKSGMPIEHNPDYHTSYESGICSLTIEETFAEDSARYTCKARNSVGTAETSAILTVKETEPEEQVSAPIFVRMLQPGVAKEGGPFQFECRVEGNPLPTVQWFKNDECIDNSPDYYITYNNGEAILKFDKVSLDDKAKYSCKAVNDLGSAQCTANLIVTAIEPIEAPVFITPLSNVMARAGQKIKLECEIVGLPPPTLTWSHNGKTVKETRETKLQLEGNKATLVVLEAFPKDAGTYTVNAKNLAGEASSTSTVSVKGRLPNETSDSELASDMEPVKPSIHVSLKNITAKEGNQVRFDCVIVGQPEPEVIWYHDGRPVKESPDFQLLFQGDRCTLVIQDALPEDAGEYKVVALNSAGEASSQCVLSVEAKESSGTTETPPKFIKLLTDVLASEADKVVFEGNVVGEPKPELKWLLNNIPITDTNHFKTQIDNVTGNFKLEINNIRPEDKGVYTVKASNSAGEAKCFAQLIVKSSKLTDAAKPYEEQKSAPVFKEQFNDRVVFAETSTKFECIVTGKPAPKVKWLFNGNPISGEGFLISTSGDRQVLSIPNLKNEHQGVITCVAENEIGKASCAANLSVQSSVEIALPVQRLPELIPTDFKEHKESSYSINREIVTKSSSSSSQMIAEKNIEVPKVEEHRTVSQQSQTFTQVNQDAPQIQKSHKIEEYHKVGDQPPVFSEKTYIYGDQADSSNIKQIQSIEQQKQLITKPARIRPPKWMTPVIGKIIDQDVDVILEGILDGQPVPKVSWTKDGKELIESDKIKIKFSLNKATVEIKNVTVQDAGRYSCTAINEGGSAVSTADLVVRKTIFPPVFGRRLQAQVIKKNDRLIMEVEVAGTPEPSITWLKDGIPIAEALKNDARLKSFGPTHTLTIDKADLKHTGRYTVRAVNEGGEAQSIADIAVFEPTPDTMVEVVKTVVFEDVKKHETLDSTSDKMSSSITTTVPVRFTSPVSTEISRLDTSKSEITSTMEQKSSQQSQSYKLEHKMPDIPMPKPIESKSPIYEKRTDYEISHELAPDRKKEIIEEKKTVTEEGGIETSSISKQTSLQYFVKKIKEGDAPVTKEIPLEPVKPIKPEIYQKFTEIKKDAPSVIIDTKSVESISVAPFSQEYKTFSSTKEATSEIKSLPIQQYKPIAKPVAPKSFSTEYSSSYSSTQHISEPQEYKTFSSEIIREHDLKPEPPAQIFYPEKKTVKQDFDSSSSKKEFSETVEKKSSYQSSSSSFSKSYQSFSGHKTPVEKSWSTKQEVAERPASVASSSFSSEKYSSYSRPISTEPSTEARQMEKQWAHKFTESSSAQPTASSSWSTQSTLEKRWAPVGVKSEKVVEESKNFLDKTAVLVPHYIGEVTRLETTVKDQIDEQYSSTKSEHIVEESNLKPSQKAWPPIQEYSIPTPPLSSIESLPLRPVSVQDITDEVFLEPGPPPEIGYAEPPKVLRRRSYVENVEQELQKIPSKVLPCAVRTIPPPPLPPKKEIPAAPPVPARPVKVSKKQQPVELPYIPFEKFPELEPFPFKAEPDRPRPPKVGPPPMPSKFVKGRFTDSDYESDFENIRIPPKWKPSISDTEEPRYRPVRPPLIKTLGRSRSQEPEPLPPSKFDQPPRFQGPPRPDVNFEEFRRKKDATQIKKMTKHFEEIRREASPPKIKPASPPTYVYPEKSPESPKAKKKVVIADGYMADTDEPFQQQFVKTEHFKEERIESSQKIFESSSTIQKTFGSKSKVTNKFPSKKHQIVPTIKNKEFVATPIITSQTTEEYSEEHQKQSHLESIPYYHHHPEPPRAKKEKVYPPATPSKFIKGEFRESDYESDYEGRVPPVWGKSTDKQYKPVRPVLTPTPTAPYHQIDDGRTPTPPTAFERPSVLEGPSRPKFEPIEKITPVPKSIVRKPKAVTAAPVTDIVPSVPIYIKPGSPPEIVYASSSSTLPKRTHIYKSATSTPYNNAVQTETSNIVHLDESTDTCKRTMSVQQTHKVIRFGDQYRHQQEKSSKIQSSYPSSTEQESSKRAVSVPPPATPSKFIRGECRESDYESEVESASRIKPKWVPGGSDTEDIRYRKVKAPSTPSKEYSAYSSQSQRIVAPTEFGRGPAQTSSTTTIRDFTDSEMKKQYSTKFSESGSSQIMKRSSSYEPASSIKPGSPPEYGFASDQRITKSTATKLASQHMNSMTKDFKSKTQQFVQDIMTDVNKKNQQSTNKVAAEGDAQVYREESRAMSHGTKHVDPDTGLIYFKYDFGYEFGIVLPGESKSGEIPVPKKTVIEPPRRTVDIEMPVYHESSQRNQNHNSAPTPQFKPKKFTNKWDPTSESEMSEYEGDLKRKSGLSQGSRWEPSSCSPYSLSPSLPSSSPAFNHTFADRTISGVQTPPSRSSTPKMVIQPGQPRLPLFITPLRDIAVLSGQTAKFECIVQSEPSPNIMWSKDGRIIENSNYWQIHYRNGVCRLIIRQTFPEDAGAYTCTATNPVGSTNTACTLQVPGERRSQYLT